MNFFIIPWLYTEHGGADCFSFAIRLLAYPFIKHNRSLS